MSRKKGRGSLTSYGEMAQRIVAAYGRAFKEVGDLPDLAGLAALNAEVEKATSVAVQELRGKGLGFSWVEIGSALGMTAENARRRYGLDEAIKKGPTIYGLRLPGSSEIFYVGQTMNLGQRLATYRNAQGSTNDITNLLRARGGDVVGVVLEYCEKEAVLDARERYWIQLMEAEGHKLMNTVHTRRKVAAKAPRCEETEEREVRGRRVPPVTVRCSGTPHHDGDHHYKGIRFGQQRPVSEWMWTRYQESLAS